MRIACGVLAASLILSGCGMTVPKMEDLSQKVPEGLEENTIVNQVKCEIHLGVQEALANPMPNGNPIKWLNDWASKVSMTLTVDEKGALAPGLTFTSPFQESAEMFSMDVGASASAEATRKETIQFTYAFADLLHEGDIKGPCSNEGGVLIHSDLKISEFIMNKMMVAQIPGSVVAGVPPPPYVGPPYSTFSDQVTFVVAVSANATPSFKLVRFAVNSKASLLSGSRTKTQDILITLAQRDKPATANTPATLTQEGQDAHNAQLIGQAIANSLRGLGLAIP
jgi:hypothetical protein